MFVLITIFSIHGNSNQSMPSEKEAIIITLDTWFYPNESKIEKRIREKISLFQGLRLAGTEKDEVKDEFFKVLEETPLAQISIDDETWKTPYVLWDENYKHPPILSQSLVAQTKEDKKIISNLIRRTVRKSRAFPRAHRTLIQLSIDYAIETPLIIDTMSQDAQMTDLLKELKKEGYQLILIVSMSKPTWQTFDTCPPARIISNIFDKENLYISGIEKKLPTSPAIFNKIIKQHHLNPNNTIAIGDNKHNLDYAREQGMKTIIYNPQKSDFNNFEKQLNAVLKKSGAA